MLDYHFFLYLPNTDIYGESWNDLISRDIVVEDIERIIIYSYSIPIEV